MTQKYEKLLEYIGKLKMKDNRAIFQHIQTQMTCENIEDLFLPKYGISVGEYCVFYLLNKSKKK